MRTKKSKQAEPKPRWEEPLEFLGWVDEEQHFHPLNDGNRWIFSASGYDWRPVYALRPA